MACVLLILQHVAFCAVPSRSSLNPLMILPSSLRSMRPIRALPVIFPHFSRAQAYSLA
tara:strand:- start:114 stop:287 length:174 start_codon:yes stop_codon:yes gene_type:complete